MYTTFYNDDAYELVLDWQGQVEYVIRYRHGYASKGAVVTFDDLPEDVQNHLLSHLENEKDTD